MGIEEGESEVQYHLQEVLVSLRHMSPSFKKVGVEAGVSSAIKLCKNEDQHSDPITVITAQA